jgi:hypothetical protein
MKPSPAETIDDNQAQLGAAGWSSEHGGQHRTRRHLDGLR